MPQPYDLHTHSWYSYDAHLSPGQLFAAAERNGLRALAITDHHNMDGFAAFAAAAEAHPSVRWVPAMEASVQTRWGEFDVVCLGLPPDAPRRLADVVDRYRDWMRRFNRRLMAGLAALNVPFGEEQKQHMLATWRPGPARETQGEVRIPNNGLLPWLRERGYLAAGVEYSLFLMRALDAAGGYPPVPEAAEVLPRFAEIGGIMLVAHPGRFLERHGEAELGALLAELGVHGIEAGHTSHTPAQAADYSDYAAAHGLLVSGGSDIHFTDELERIGEHKCPPRQAAALLQRLGIAE